MLQLKLLNGFRLHLVLGLTEGQLVSTSSQLEHENGRTDKTSPFWCQEVNICPTSSLRLYHNLLRVHEYSILVQLWSPRHRYETNVKIDAKEIRCEGVDWTLS
jgi:hypothetical protein